MHIKEIFERYSTTFSFEFFPPKTRKGAENLLRSIEQLEEFKPSFVSVTYGAGGSTRELTHDLVVHLHKKTELDPIAHLTCVGHQENEVQKILERYADAGISNIMALHGDLPQGDASYDRSGDSFPHAIDLVKFIKKFNQSGRHKDKRGFGIGVAGFPEGHPDTPNRVLEMDYLKAKVDAGADYICTQLFFDNRDFYDFVERCELAGIKVPIVAGIMPITSKKGMLRMADLAAGARFPAALLKAIDRCGGDELAISRVGTHWATEQCRDLLHKNVKGIHFYTLNKSDATKEIYKNLGISNTEVLKNGAAS